MGFELFSYEDLEDCGGYFNKYNKTIVIAGEEEDELTTTFCHEFSHLLQFKAGLEYHNGTFSSAIDSEQQACVLSVHLYDWLFGHLEVDRKKISEYLLSYFKESSMDFLRDWYTGCGGNRYHWGLDMDY